MTVEQGLRKEFHNRRKVLARALRAAREQGTLNNEFDGLCSGYTFDWEKSKEGWSYWIKIEDRKPNPDQYLPEGYVDVEDEEPKEISPWTMVEDGLPKHENNVLAVLDGKVCVMAYFSFKDGGETFKVWGYVYDGLDGDPYPDDDYKPTKWMEIPKP